MRRAYRVVDYKVMRVVSADERTGAMLFGMFETWLDGVASGKRFATPGELMLNGQWRS